MKPVTVALVLCALSVLLTPVPVGAEQPSRPVVRLVGEAGFLGVIDHRIRFSGDDPTFRYDKDGGQDVLFPFARLSAELSWQDRHTIVFLYQPLELETRADLPSNFTVDGVPFTGDGLVSRYSFPFYRMSYLYRFIDTNRWRLDGGGSLQIRNATIEFSAEGTGGDGSDGPSGFYRSAGVGPVPLLKLRARYNLPQEFYLETEIDGIYAPISYLNGSDNDTVGALLDASLRAGYHVTDTIDAFINVRYLGGGASNTDPADYSVNWLNTYSVSLGTAVRLGERGD